VYDDDDDLGVGRFRKEEKIKKCTSFSRRGGGNEHMKTTCVSLCQRHSKGTPEVKRAKSHSDRLFFLFLLNFILRREIVVENRNLEKWKGTRADKSSSTTFMKIVRHIFSLSLSFFFL
jgi:hypothetical protein